MTAPVALFAYARPEHLAKTLASLSANPRARDTPLIIFCDGPRSNEDTHNVKMVRDVANNVTGFKSVDVRARSKNVGLAANIIEGVSDVCDTYGRVIVLEDDMVVAPGFLDYMNDALDCFEPQKAVWHVTGWNYPIDPTGLPETFLWRGMNCWGWGTWADRWAHFEKNPQRLLSSWSLTKIDRFNIDRAEPDFWAQVEANARGTLNTWAIFWYATIFEQGGLCLNPTKSLVLNIGFDGSGEHCGPDAENTQSTQLGEKTSVELPNEIKEHPKALLRIQAILNAQPRGSFRRKARKRLKLWLKYGLRA